MDGDKLQAIKSVSMDMWPAYIKATEEHVPDAENKIVLDHFHIAKQSGAAMGTTRRDVQQQSQASAGKTLKGAHHMLRYSARNLPRRYRARMKQLFAEYAVLARAWTLKESLRHL